MRMKTPLQLIFEDQSITKIPGRYELFGTNFPLRNFLLDQDS